MCQLLSLAESPPSSFFHFFFSFIVALFRTIIILALGEVALLQAVLRFRSVSEASAPEGLTRG